MNFFELDQQVNQEVDKNSYLRLMGKLSQKIGQKSNTYSQLIRYVAKNPAMLSLFEQLIEETSMAQAGKLKSVLSTPVANPIKH